MHVQLQLSPSSPACAQLSTVLAPPVALPACWPAGCVSECSSHCACAIPHISPLLIDALAIAYTMIHTKSQCCTKYFPPVCAIQQVCLHADAAMIRLLGEPAGACLSRQPGTHPARMAWSTVTSGWSLSSPPSDSRSVQRPNTPEVMGRRNRGADWAHASLQQPCSSSYKPGQPQPGLCQATQNVLALQLSLLSPAPAAAAAACLWDSAAAGPDDLRIPTACS